jgi:tight adherence protein B
MMDDLGTLEIAIGIAVIAMIAGVGLVMSKPKTTAAEDRLTGLVNGRKVSKAKKQDLSSGILARPAAIDLGRPSFWTRALPNVENLNLLFEQADVSITFNQFMATVAGLGFAGAIFAVLFRLPALAVPIVALVWCALPFAWLAQRRQKRINQFVESMPEAVELVSRALRAGHSLASGLRLVAEEMKGPIADEYNRIFEEQNLGIPIELALRNLADRVPVMDVRFFVIAVVIQRSTGGDLAEVLDKIGRLIRQRFELRGHVKALTAEGRLSGVVLLAMPPAMLVLLWFLNREYVSVLFNNPTGVKMLQFTAAGQVVGAWVIKKIVAIRV